MEMITYAASIRLLGGSGEQAMRVQAYVSGQSPEMPNICWGANHAPTSLISGDITLKIIKLINGGYIRSLMASQKSTRGARCNRLRFDEIDEADQPLVESSLGIPMESRGIVEQVVLSSTHHNPNGTMTFYKDQAAEKDWKVYHWCFRESMGTTEHPGWLTQRMIDFKKGIVTKQTWLNEFELQEPNPEGRSIDPGELERMFDEQYYIDHGIADSWDDVPGDAGIYYEFEAPIDQGEYYVMGDWAKTRDWSIFITLRVDQMIRDEPARIVSFERRGREKYPEMVAAFEETIRRYNAFAAHDSTGLGDVIDDYLVEDVTGYDMAGKKRVEMINELIGAIENGEIISPKIKFMYNQLKHMTNKDVMIAGGGHLPDCTASLSVGWKLYRFYNPKTFIDVEMMERLGKVENYDNRFGDGSVELMDENPYI